MLQTVVDRTHPRSLSLALSGSRTGKESRLPDLSDSGSALAEPRISLGDNYNGHQFANALTLCELTGTKCLDPVLTLWKPIVDEMRAIGILLEVNPNG